MATSGILTDFAMYKGKELFVIVQALDYQDAIRILKIHGHDVMNYSVGQYFIWKTLVSCGLK